MPVIVVPNTETPESLLTGLLRKLSAGHGPGRTAAFGPATKSMTTIGHVFIPLNRTHDGTPPADDDLGAF
jgi:hypothetical protein